MELMRTLAAERPFSFSFLFFFFYLFQTLEHLFRMLEAKRKIDRFYRDVVYLCTSAIDFSRSENAPIYSRSNNFIVSVVTKSGKSINIVSFFENVILNENSQITVGRTA